MRRGTVSRGKNSGRKRKRELARSRGYFCEKLEIALDIFYILPIYKYVCVRYDMGKWSLVFFSYWEKSSGVNFCVSSKLETFFFFHFTKAMVI